MPFFQQRQRRAAKRAAAAAGNPPPLVDRFSTEARVKLVYALVDGAPSRVLPTAEIGLITPEHILSQATFALLRDWGRPRIDPEDLKTYMVQKATDVEVLDIIEAWAPALGELVAQVDSGSGVFYPGGSPSARSVPALVEHLAAKVNEILDDHDMAWQMSQGEMVPRSSTAMHTTIVEPVLSLTAGNPKYQKVERAYRDALGELKPGGKAGDAITDAGTALQEALRAVGASGDQLSTLLADARRKGLLAPYDSKLTEAIGLIGDWVGADRSQRGDSHHVRDAADEDAWLAVRIAGALILRLVAGRTR